MAAGSIQTSGRGGRRRSRVAERAFIVTVGPGADASTARELRRVGVRSYSPKYLEYRRSEGVAVPLFPGYVFVWPAEREQWRECRVARGVIDFVRTTGGEPGSVPQQVIDGIRAAESPYGYVQFDRVFVVGDQVRVAEGTARGRVTRLLARQRVSVLFALLGKHVEISVDERELVAA